MSVLSQDPALDEALESISDLAARLWAVRQTHRPVVAAGCGWATPCPTLRAAG